MFDIGWSEMAVIALLTLIVIGPRELPRVMRTVGQWVKKAQSLAREFQRGLDEMAREADLEDAKKLVDAGRSIANPKKMVMDHLDPTGSVEAEARDLQASVTAEAPTASSDTSPPDTSSSDANAAPASAAKTNEQTPASGDPAAPAGSAGNGAPASQTSVSSETTAAPKAAAEPEPAANPTPKTKTAAAGSGGSQKTA